MIGWCVFTVMIQMNWNENWMKLIINLFFSYHCKLNTVPFGSWLTKLFIWFATGVCRCNLSCNLNCSLSLCDRLCSQLLLQEQRLQQQQQQQCHQWTRLTSNHKHSLQSSNRLHLLLWSAPPPSKEHRLHPVLLLPNDQLDASRLARPSRQQFSCHPANRPLVSRLYLSSRYLSSRCLSHQLPKLSLPPLRLAKNQLSR